MGKSRASPHTRGWTPDVMADALRARGFPAHAGMDRSRRGSSTETRRLPRTRGDGPVVGWSTGRCGTASPHTRGWTRAIRLAGSPARGFPAHAGMDPPRWWRASRRRRLPRTRGDGPPLDGAQICDSTASPHTRGWTLRMAMDLNEQGGFPAHAGMDPRSTRPTAPVSRLPRTRGDGPWRDPEKDAMRTASPHTRGWTLEGVHDKKVEGFFVGGVSSER